MHLCASVTNTVTFELKPNWNPMQHELVEDPIAQAEGYMRVNNAQRLGVTVRGTVVQKYLFHRAGPHSFRQPTGHGEASWSTRT